MRTCFFSTKKILLNMIILCAANFLFAQSVEEEIELPDVTTVVNGKTFTAGKDSVPDYTKILPENSSPEVSLPKMDGVKTSPKRTESRERISQKEKDIYAQGELGAGYPFYFKGDFSVYRASGDSPFEIDFTHESAEGFARKKSNEGYFVRNTAVTGKKSFFGDYGNHAFGAEYKMSDDGLQLESDTYSDMVRHTISGNASSDWRIPNGFLISYGADGAWFNRYGQIMKDSVSSGDFYDTTKILDVNPYFGFGWQGHGFKTILKGLYGFQANLEDTSNLQKIEGSSSAEASHRGQFKLAFSWENESVTVGADGSLIVGTAIGKKEVIPAFTGIFDLKTKAFSEGRYFTLSVRGGIDSYQEKIRNLENKYRFSVVPAIPVETTDWFSKVDASLPILSAFELKGGFEFRKSVFENGVWQSEFKKSERYKGLYIISPKERTEINSALGFYADFAPVKASVEWKSYWKDIPSLEDEQKIKFSLEYQSADAKWNAGTSTAVSLGEDADLCPDISAWAGLRLASNLSLALEVNDVIKLFHGTSRDYAHSEYITTSGNAVLLAKFQF
ncbi:hypothetical protein [uncultured Treponema sp.]|uniref:hypothetical protein n=2 Tax=Treponema TaxID=157 RepID=UPI0025D93923|nr:hypothetical protein [uncultured Treponema sp.]